MLFTTRYPKSCSIIGTKIISELNSFLFTKECHVQNGEDACNGAYFVNLLDDSELLDLGSVFKHCLLLDTCALIKNNMLSTFMLSGSIQFSIPLQFNTNHAFVKIMSLYNVCVM